MKGMEKCKPKQPPVWLFSTHAFTLMFVMPPLEETFVMPSLGETFVMPMGFQSAPIKKETH